ncbi:ATP-dependent RNA helicase DDX51 [Zancudomyces culisetae]|uniref:ATP-dependent RNA helicase n=1 Tax=Zancudomyces culisetae TaxID=1213189 RepID=A0A1R1PPI0_ZANCU|nr:ATP-dependent RNA helicase DDX51 [Zancudomyces culisetae]|eukprot:OMH82868.1 ATP-dependent RNA helicase DDX51 [Zancudomyces culisetae]
MKIEQVETETKSKKGQEVGRDKLKRKDKQEKYKKILEVANKRIKTNTEPQNKNEEIDEIDEIKEQEQQEQEESEGQSDEQEEAELEQDSKVNDKHTGLGALKSFPSFSNQQETTQKATHAAGRSKVGLPEWVKNPILVDLNLKYKLEPCKNHKVFTDGNSLDRTTGTQVGGGSSNNKELKRLEVIIIVPSKELVKQVYKVFTGIVNGTGGSEIRQRIKVGMVSGEESMNKESERLGLQAVSVGGDYGGGSRIQYYLGNYNVLICTPGRLVDHLNNQTIRLDYVNLMVFDEADKLVRQNYQDLVARINQYENINSSNNSTGTDTDTETDTENNTSFNNGNGNWNWNGNWNDLILVNGNKTTFNNNRNGSNGNVIRRIQKVFYSASLLSNNQDIIKLFQLTLVNPKFVKIEQRISTLSSVPKINNDLDNEGGDEKEKQVGETEGKGDGEEVSSLPANLKQRYIIVSSFHKPIALIHYLNELCNATKLIATTSTKTSLNVNGNVNILVFTNTYDTNSRLYKLLQLYFDNSNQDIEICEYLPQNNKQNSTILQKFKPTTANNTTEQTNKTLPKCQVLVSTDSLSRGLDLDINLVVNYDPPLTFNQYLHRIGRTCRGLSSSLISPTSTSPSKKTSTSTKTSKLDLDSDLDLDLDLAANIENSKNLIESFNNSAVSLVANSQAFHFRKDIISNIPRSTNPIDLLKLKTPTFELYLQKYQDCLSKLEQLY